MPAPVHALAASGQPLGKGGHQIDLYDLNKALARRQLSTSQKMQLKASMGRHGLLQDGQPRRAFGWSLTSAFRQPGFKSAFGANRPWTRGLSRRGAAAGGPGKTSW